MGLIGSGTTNDCNILTIFPLGVECDSTNPTTSTSLNGIVSLIITGGTSPYTITWSNGGTSPTLYGLGGGDYTATVVDYYGDFTSVTTCSLIQPTTTTTTYIVLPTIRPYEPGISFCFSKCDGTDCDIYDFEPGNIINGYNSWTSSTLTIFYNAPSNRWQLSGYTVPVGYNLGVTYSNDSPLANPPESWETRGSNYRTNISVTDGPCNTRPTTFSRSVTNSSCSTAKDGTIAITPIGGSGSYSYSKNGGLVYQTSPVFTSLEAGQYTVVVRDNVTNATSSEVISIVNNSVVRSFNLNITPTVPTTTYTPPSSVYDVVQNSNQTKEINLISLIPAPTLQQGETLNFNVVFKGQTEFRTPGSATFNNNLLLYKNGVLITATTVTTSALSMGVGDCLGQTITKISKTTNYTSLSLTYGDTLTAGLYSNTELSATISTSGCTSYANNLVSLYAENLSISPQKCKIINSSITNIVQFSNNLAYIPPPLNLTFSNRWITAEETPISGFTYGGNPNSATSPGTTPKISYNLTDGCLNQNISCFPLSNTTSGGPVYIVNQNQKTFQAGVRGQTINLWLQLGGILSGGACNKIFGTLKVSINSGSYAVLTTLNGGTEACSKTYSYVLPLNANSIEFVWEQTRI